MQGLNRPQRIKDGLCQDKSTSWNRENKNQSTEIVNGAQSASKIYSNFQKLKMWDYLNGVNNFSNGITFLRVKREKYTTNNVAMN